MSAALGLGLGPGTPVISLGNIRPRHTWCRRRGPPIHRGDVAGFADASGRFLPLACTLNCTLAVDRMAEWLRLGSRRRGPSRGVVTLPYFDGERTPKRARRIRAVLGLRHGTDPRSILMATYEGAVVGLLDALETIDGCSSASTLRRRWS